VRRLAISFGASSLAVYLLGPTVKAAGFSTLLLVMAAISACTALFVVLLPATAPRAQADQLRVSGTSRETAHRGAPALSSPGISSR
jgi:hypothetical protein